MRKVIQVPRDEEVVTLASDIVYGQRQEWCHAKYRQLRMSLMKPRCNYSYDEDKNYPLIVWLCGGSFAEVDRNVWIPELVYFAKQGFAVAAVDYSVIQLTRYPDQLVDIKEAIRYIRAHAQEFHIDPDRIAVMGESAGGYLSILAGMTGQDQTFDNGTYPEFSSEVQAVVAWYPCVEMEWLVPGRKDVNMAEDVENFPNLSGMVKEGMPPCLLLHGTADQLVPAKHSETLYRALEEKGNTVDFYLVEGADHADRPFVNTEVKQIIADFLKQYI